MRYLHCLVRAVAWHHPRVRLAARLVRGEEALSSNLRWVTFRRSTERTRTPFRKRLRLNPVAGSIPAASARCACTLVADYLSSKEVAGVRFALRALGFGVAALHSSL